MKTADIVHRGHTARRNKLRCSPRSHRLGAVYCVLQGVSLKSDRFDVSVHWATVACRVVNVFGCANSPPTQCCAERLRSPVSEKEHPWNHPLHSVCTERVRKAIFFAALAKSAHQTADVSGDQSPSFPRLHRHSRYSRRRIQRLKLASSKNIYGYRSPTAKYAEARFRVCASKLRQRAPRARDL